MSSPTVRVISQASPRRDPSAAEMSVRAFTGAAELQGLPVHYIPVDWDEFSAEDVLSFVPDGLSQAVLIGYIGDNDYYRQLDAALRAKGIELINTPEQSECAQEFDHFYPLIHDLTAQSLVVDSIEDADRAVKKIGFPMFVKGGIKSNKEDGWDACVVHDLVGLRERYAHFQRLPLLARGKMIARKILPLRKSGELIGGFPESREYRVFLMFGQPAEHGYYWRSSEDPFGPLSLKDETSMLRLASVAANRVGCPLMTVDVGQLEGGEWVVIETGDLQFSGINQMNPLRFWQKLGQYLAGIQEF